MVVTDKYIFVHVPKTGGQSVSRALGGKTKSIPTHAPLYAHNNFGTFRFGFVRNPWDRMVSLYHYLCQKTFKHTDNFRQPEVRAAGFKGWLMDHEFYMQEDYLPAGECWVVGGRDTKSMKPMQQRPQMFWLDGCDFIGRFEGLAKDFARACKIAGIRASPLPHVNPTQHKQYREYYDNDSQAFVAYHFAEDIEKFGYQF